ncbi:COX15/CtaA family protein [Thiohalophilus thiocyanatoxydans]|uniref:Cytochrome c oxidase assembly protein subunit 15 n=1 Tax=Thiohalophilus thiocyanatoxydans TaxID=381308 RepID=A0A4R8J2K5_9GAMM|nr:COX15/CtaA family protein [Thiohalophilus thiocyanatoxydans]TDY04093.1 cytochrome c oxidase assembly protein subunit 15 [Thiohalophilus thiocyanatoxydans]
MNKETLFARLGFIATALALCVVILGAYVRLSDAGLGCPDWPGCYGYLGVPKTEQEVMTANSLYPERPVEAHKAWKEMIHRYFAGILGLLVFSLAFIAWRNRRHPGQALKLPLFLSVLIIFQALLGMWTVTIKLKPLIVMLHLMGGMATLSLLWWLTLRHLNLFARLRGAIQESRLKKLALVGLLVVVGQIMLGGWTSANYAALHCTDFPTCQGEWWPQTDFGEAFTMWHGIGPDYEGGVMSNTARVTVHVTHRVGALVVFLYLGALGLMLLLGRFGGSLRPMGLTLLLIMLLQVSLGIANVLLSLPLGVAVAHNGVGALLLLTLVSLNHLAFKPRRT